MSTLRAITQLIKSRTNTALKLAALEEEKAATIAAVKEKYAEKEKALTDSLKSTETALKALGVDVDNIAKGSTEDKE